MKYKWNLKDLENIKKNWYKVFSFFSCWWWSSMWYKNAGFEVLWGCDIDKQMVNVYKKNHNPKIMYWDWIIEFNKLDNNLIEKELFNLDILDWSPPCSTFSTSWEREKNWWKEKMFREWQEKQILDDLVFEYIRTVNKLKPKTFLLENVSWILKWKAKWYAKEIVKQWEEIWYNMKVFLLNWWTMWLPQARERVFFIWVRKDIWENKLKLNFNEPPIYFKEVDEWFLKEFTKIDNCDIIYYKQCLQWKSIASIHPKWNRFNSIKLSYNKVCNTIAAWSCLYHPTQERKLSKKELCLIGSYPLDYDFCWIKPLYLIWMSVPPLMIYRIAKEIKEQILDNFTTI